MQGQLFGMICLLKVSLFSPGQLLYVAVHQMNVAGICIAPLIELDCRCRMAPVDILL